MKVGDRVILRECDNEGVHYSWSVVTKVGRKYFEIEGDARYYLDTGYKASGNRSSERVFSTLSDLYDYVYRSISGKFILNELRSQHYNVITTAQLKEIALILGLAEEIDSQVKERIGHLETDT